MGLWTDWRFAEGARRFPGHCSQGQNCRNCMESPFGRSGIERARGRGSWGRWTGKKFVFSERDCLVMKCITKLSILGYIVYFEREKISTILTPKSSKAIFSSKLTKTVMSTPSVKQTRIFCFAYLT